MVKQSKSKIVSHKVILRMVLRYSTSLILLKVYVWEQGMSQDCVGNVAKVKISTGSCVRAH